jgi:Xaa-Pro aminopeptidase
MNARLKQLYDKIKNKCDSILLVSGGDRPDMNLFYYGGLNALDAGGALYWKFDKEPTLLLSDINQKSQIENAVQRRGGDDLYRLVEDYGKIQKIGFNGERVTIRTMMKLQEKLPTMRFVDISEEMRDIRAIKDNAELASIKAAADLSKKALRLAERMVGKRESEVFHAINEFYLSKGARPAFDPIVSSGENTALIHTFPTDKKIGAKDMVIIDTGARVDGYCADYTTSFCRKPGEQERVILELVKEAMKEAQRVVRPGMRGGEAYDAVKRVFSDFAKYWPYGLGHGVGLDIHEHPNIGPGSEDVLRKGMVFTLEPGLIVPEVGGARTEVTGVLQAKGFKPF